MAEFELSGVTRGAMRLTAVMTPETCQNDESDGSANHNSRLVNGSNVNDISPRVDAGYLQ
jgi:hypothetical protein